MHVLRRLLTENRGVTALEYGLIAMLVALALIGGATTLGTRLSTYYSDLAHSVTTAM